MSLPRFQLIEKTTLAEACSFLQETKGAARLLAGGTDLLIRMKHRLLAPEFLVNLKAIPQLSQITLNGQGEVSIGALTTLNEVADSLLLQERLPVLQEAAGRVAATQIRNRATLGGNICLDARCWYYNQPLTWRLARPFCFKMGGDCCHVVKRGKECYALFSADTPPVLIALNASIKIASSKGERVLPLAELYTGEGREVTRLKAEEILTEVIVPALPDRAGAAYLKYAVRQAPDFPLVGVAAFISLDGNEGLCSRARIVFAGVTSSPAEAQEAGAGLAGTRLTEAALARAAKAAAREVKLFADIYCSAGYRKRIMEVYAHQALLAAWQRAKDSSFPTYVGTKVGTTEKER